MLYISLAASVVLLVVVNGIVARAKYAVVKTLVAGFVFTVCPIGMMIFLPAVALQAAMMCALLLLLITQRGKRLYLPLSCASVFIAYGIVMYSAVEKQHEYAQLRDQYPFESIEARLPHRPPSEMVKLANLEQLNNIERGIDREEGFGRTYNLKSLHERSVETFVNSAGFGVGRMVRFDPNAESLSKDLQSTTPIPQPDYLKPFAPPTGKLSDLLPEWNAVSIGRMHDNGVIDFVNARNFGYVKDRQHVAGFQRHGMTKVPVAEASPWSVARVDLVGLVIHDSPVAYVSANLPRMNELREAQTRPLDDFELDALESLKNGEDLYARGLDDQARMLGAIRATKQCLACHGGSRGDLLGAFSYGLRREGK